LSRRIFIGDIQGCLPELDRLLKKVDFDEKRDQLHPVGDLVNRGPDSAGCLRLLRDLDAQAVLGNHDLRLLRVWGGMQKMPPRGTLAEVFEAPDCDELLEWLSTQPFMRSFSDIYQVHGGLHPQWNDPEQELTSVDPYPIDPRTTFVTRVRHCDAKGQRPDDELDAPSPPFFPWFRFYEHEQHGGRTVVFGHWSDLNGVDEPHVKGLDTGCVWGRTLTAWIPEEDRLVSVPAEKAYWQL
jgi:bis(5'-nucleosyl)-tetraphosphatase (symmetrical)